MPNLVGTGLNQVPTNSMLGGLAYQSPDNASIKDLDLKNLSQINSEIADTAVDIFVYDTSKDSDGGAWRHRTQHTSWYNETLNTSTRGSRREFPAVAVIVAESAKVTIYDGDDPDLPMWMVTSSGGSAHSTDNILGDTSTQFKSISMLNGLLCVANYTYALRTLDFIKEEALRFHSGSLRKYAGNVSERDAGKGTIDISSIDTRRIVNAQPNDVAMTVLPSAPIDDATGLPVPTIAVATDGGVSVIKDDGNVYDSSFTASVNYLSFSESGDRLFVSRNDNKVFTSSITSSISADGWGNDNEYYRKDVTNTTNFPWINEDSSGSAISRKNEKNVYGSQYGLTVIDETPGVVGSGMGAWITSDYNTGWMHGDIKGAFLSDTSTTNRDADTENLITGQKHDYEVNTTEAWSSQSSGSATYNASNGVGGGGCIRLTSSGGSNIWNSISFDGLTANTTYTLRFSAKNSATAGTNTSISVTQSAFNVGAQLLKGGTSTVYTNTVQNTYEEVVLQFNTQSYTLVRLNVYANNGSGAELFLDEFYITEVEQDRSINDYGLAVYGTITKSAVATGAELVGYSGFNASNNLVQPYNSSLNFGTGDFSVVAWIKKSTLSSNHYIFDRMDGSTQNGRLALYITTSGVINISTGGGNSQATTTSGIFTGSPNWRMIMVKRTGGVIVFGLDGKEYSSTTISGDWSTDNVTGSGDEELTIGQYGGGPNGSKTFNYDYAIDGISNFRISASAPTAEQFKKMYEDEKMLFQENAKATLYGSSDAITALAYDDKKELLHVGTSSGRSDFQGLRRINNTTTAVTTAISASKGFVAEQ
jgi:hypothetical protein